MHPLAAGRTWRVSSPSARSLSAPVLGASVHRVLYGAALESSPLHVGPRVGGQGSVSDLVTAASWPVGQTLEVLDTRAGG